MRVTPAELQELLLKQKGQQYLKEKLKRIFSFPENLDAYSTFFFPEAIQGSVPEFHREFYEWMDSRENGARAEPRGSAKTTRAGLVYTTWCIIYKREKYIVYMSQNYKKTVQFLTPVRHEFKNNKWLKLVYGDMSPKAAKDEDGRDREDCIDINGIRLEAVSFENNIRGFKYLHSRPTLIIGDDIEDDMRVLNPELRKKDMDKLNKAVIPSLDVKCGRFKIFGTILHHDSLLKKKITSSNGVILEACDAEFKNLLWPGQLTEAFLRKRYKEIGSVAFESEYRNNPRDDESSLIKPKWVRACFRPDLSSQECQAMQYSSTALGVDFAFSDRITADESAFVSVGCKDDFYYIFDCCKKKGMSVGEQMIMIKTILHKKYRYNTIAVEENSIRAVSKDLSKHNLPFKLFWTAAKDPAKKQTQDRNFVHKRYTVGKFNLIQRLATQFENGRIIIPYKTEADQLIAEVILAECTSYALSDGKIVEAGVHPDIPIGLGYALESLTMNEVSFFMG